MPLFDYHCTSCKQTFEWLVRSLNEEVHCVKCNSDQVQKQLGVPAKPGKSSTSAESCAMPACKSGMCAMPNNRCGM